MPLAAGVLLKGRYRISRFLAQGQSGAVYQGWDLQLKRNCAIKEYLDISLGNRQRFERMAEQLIGLDHPGLPKVWDAFLQPGSGLYLVMAYVEGDDLRQRLLGGAGGLPEGQAVGWMAQVCEGVAYLHEQMPPVYHGDIKPANMRITGEGRAMLVDLGTLREGRGETESSIASANAPFVAPEAAEEGRWDEQSEVYALGATLYTLLTGNPPSEAEKGKPGFARRGGVSPRVGLLIERAIRSDRSGRVESVAEFRRLLLEAVAAPDEGATRQLSLKTQASVKGKTAVQASFWGRIPWAGLFFLMGIVVVVMGIFVNRPGGLFGGIAPAEASATPEALLTAQTPGVGQTPRSAPTATPAASTLQPSPSFTAEVSVQSVAETLAPTPTQTPTQTLTPTAVTAPNGFYFFAGHETGVFSVAYSADGESVASGSADGQIMVWKAYTGAVVHVLQGHSEGVNTLSFSPDGRRLASGGVDKTVVVWDVEKGEKVHVLTKHSKAISEVAFSADGMRLACASQDSTVTIWDTQSGELVESLVANVSKDLPAGFTSVAFYPGGGLLAAGSAKGVVLWDTGLWAEVRNVSGNVLSLAYTADGKRLAMGLMTGGVAVWDMESYRLVYTFQKHIRPVTGVAFAADGNLLASVARDGQIILWDVAQRSIYRILEGHSDAVTDVAFSPDGRLLVTASVDGTVILWALP